MIKNPDELLKALRPSRGRKPRFAGVILWQGASALDGAPIVVIATGLGRKSTNIKTGAMIQTFIIRADVHPVAALESGADASICGACPHRPANNGTCYVQVGRSVAAVYRTFKAGRYAEPGRDYDKALLPRLFTGRVVRLGAYGDPAAAPFPMWRAVTVNAAAKAGYSHQWRDARFQAFKLLCMASADSAADEAEAEALGWRAFRVRHAAEPLLPHEVICPASAEAGFKTVCAKCRACGGTSAKAKAHIAIVVHGAAKRRFALAA